MNHFCQCLFATRQRGFSMVEMLVALMLSLILTAGIIQLFIGSKQTYRFHDALSRLQENGRFAIESMAADIRMAGFPNNPTNAVETNGTDGNGNDDITVRWNGGTQSRVYSVGPGTGPAPACPAAANSLRLNRNNGGAQELIEGVQAMQILYGVCDTDTDGDGRNDSITVPPGYITAANVAVADWPNVCSVRIHLLLVSMENNVVTQPQTVFFPADTVNTVVPADRCLRQAFSTTIAIRNRIP